MMTGKEKLGIALDLALPLRGAIRLLGDGKWKEAGVSVGFSTIIMLVVITAMKEGDWGLGAGAYLLSNLGVNWISGCYVEKRSYNDKIAHE